MVPMLDCLVTYFGLDENDQPTLGRYYAYHIIAGPGPTPRAGVAFINTVGLFDETERCTFCERFHAAETGGPAEALARAIHYLDAVHQGKHLRRVQSDIRGLANSQAKSADRPQLQSSV